ncbi:nonsense-mediated mRNA decay factor SMG7 isoform X2 [Lethenteron reissneri]|uniref:nonsense-mediated mRNA decay factor SMG7 isoform X2 n=1 Tax=Lethenteron reissneri TaxID=7753 RepID=UPI002AB7922F|nr:nonsense-mediated mRNA decay factor SMG7 isoform X2 [Lethenteron reissneri]
MGDCALCLRQAEALKADMADGSLSAADVWTSRQNLQDVYQKMLLTDLEYALDKKVEQDLWNYAFKNQISSLQGQAKNRANPNRGEVQTNLGLFLEAASGFYTQLLQELCVVFEVDLPCRVRSSQLGLGIGPPPPMEPAIVKPQPNSCLYICQHCLVHLGDIARYRNQISQAESYYRHAAQLVPSNGQPYNQLAILASSRGDHLTTIFYYCRSIAVRFPFPAAGTNLSKALSKAIEGREEPKVKIGLLDFLKLFIRFHAHVYLGKSLDRLVTLSHKLEEAFKGLLAVRALSAQQLVHLVVVTLFQMHHLREGGGGGAVEEQQPEAEQQQQHDGDDDDDETRWTNALTLYSALLDGLCRYAVLPANEEVRAPSALPAVKVALEWLGARPVVVEHRALQQHCQLWPSLARLLNSLQSAPNDLDGTDAQSSAPLPEEFELQGFLALKCDTRALEFTRGHQGVATEKDGLQQRVRRFRICALGRRLALAHPSVLQCTIENGLLKFSSPVPEMIVDDVLSRAAVATTTTPPPIPAAAVVVAEEEEDEEEERDEDGRGTTAPAPADDDAEAKRETPAAPLTATPRHRGPTGASPDVPESLETPDVASRSPFSKPWGSSIHSPALGRDRGETEGGRVVVVCERAGGGGGHSPRFDLPWAESRRRCGGDTRRHNVAVQKAVPQPAPPLVAEHQKPQPVQPGLGPLASAPVPPTVAFPPAPPLPSTLHAPGSFPALPGRPDHPAQPFAMPLPQQQQPAPASAVSLSYPVVPGFPYSAGSGAGAPTGTAPLLAPFMQAPPGAHSPTGKPSHVPYSQQRVAGTVGNGAAAAAAALAAAAAVVAPPPHSPGAGRAGSPAVQSLADSQAQNWPHYGGKTLHPLSMQQQQLVQQQQQQHLVQQHLAQQQQLQQQQHQLFQKSPLVNLLSQIANLHHQQQQHPLHHQQQVDKSAGRMKTYGTRLGVTEPPCDSSSRPCVWESAYGLSGQWGVPLQQGSGQPGHGGMKPPSMDMDTYDVRAMESERETLVGASTNAVGGGGGGGRPDFCQAPGAPVVKTNFMGGRMRQDQSPERQGMPAPFPTSFGGGGGGGGTAFTMHTVFSEPYGKRGEGGMGLTSNSCSSSASSSCRPSLLSDISRPYTLFDSNSWSPAFGNSEHSTPASQSPQSSQPSSPPPPSSMFGPIGTLDPTDRRATTSATADRWNGKRPEKPGAASGYGLDYLPSDATWPPPPRVLPSQALHATSRGGGGGAAPWMGVQHASEPPPSLADNLKSLWSNSVMQPGPLALEQLLMQQKQKQFNLGQSNPPH